MDQLGYLRRIKRHSEPLHADAMGRETPWVWSIASGKGGVGKTTIAAALAVMLARRGARILLAEGDLHLPNLHYLFPDGRGADLDMWISGKRNLEMLICRVEKNLHVFAPSDAPSVQGELSGHYVEKILAAAGDKYDFLLFDLANGFLPVHQKICQISDELSVLSTAEPASVANAYAFIKLARRENADLFLNVIINKSVCAEAGQDAFEKLNAITDHFLSEQLQLEAIVLADPRIARFWQENIPIAQWPEANSLFQGLSKLIETKPQRQRRSGTALQHRAVRTAPLS